MTDKERQQVLLQFESVLLAHTTHQHGGPTSLVLSCVECQTIWRCLAQYQAAPVTRSPTPAGGRRR